MILRLIFIAMLQLACGQTTTYNGDGYCNDNDEACEAYSFLFWDYAKVRMAFGQNSLACRSYVTVCNTLYNDTLGSSVLH